MIFFIGRSSFGANPDVPRSTGSIATLRSHERRVDENNMARLTFESLNVGGFLVPAGRIEIPGRRHHVAPFNAEVAMDSSGIRFAKNSASPVGMNLLVARLEASRPLGITNVALIPACGLGCGAAFVPYEILIDGTIHWERPISLQGDHQIGVVVAEGIFSEDGPFHAPLVLSVTVVSDDGKTINTLRVPITKPDPDGRFETGDLVSVGFRLRFFGQVVDGDGPRAHGLTVAFEVGRWMGPLRLTVGFGVGGTDASRALYRQITDSNKGTVFFSVAPTVAGTLFAYTGHAVLAEVSYEGAIGSTSNLPSPGLTKSTSNYAAFFHGPRVGVEWVKNLTEVMGVPRHIPLSYYGLEVSVARQRWPGMLPTVPAAWSVGIALVLFGSS